MAEQLDNQLFLFLNSAHSPFWDKIMFFLSMVFVWIPLYFTILVYMARKYKMKFFAILFFVILSVTFADQGALLIKNSVGRFRPCHEPALQGLVHTVNGICGGMYGFVSSHAANSFNIALISLMFIKNRWYSVLILIWAAAISYSRIYLGVHYPGDVLCGALLGSLTGWSMYKMYVLFDRRFFKHSPTFLKVGQSPSRTNTPSRGQVDDEKIERV